MLLPILFILNTLHFFGDTLRISYDLAQNNEREETTFGTVTCDGFSPDLNTNGEHQTLSMMDDIKDTCKRWLAWIGISPSSEGDFRKIGCGTQC
jgi:hypothetical protein